MFEWNGSSLTDAPNPPNGSGDSSYYGHLLMLPTGQIMFTDFSNDVELFNSAGSPYTGWNPTLLLSSLVFHMERPLSQRYQLQRRHAEQCLW